MSGSKNKADARILTERIEHWPSMAGWWRTSPVQQLACNVCIEASHDTFTKIPDGALVFIPGIPAGACYCEKHALSPISEEEPLLPETQAGRSTALSLAERNVLAYERLAAAVERFANTFESLVNPVVRYIKHITRQQ